MSQGRVPYHEHDDADIRSALAEALKERKIRLTDRRLLILYAVFMVLLAFVANDQRRSEMERRHFERAVVANCQASQANAENFNLLVDTLVRNYRSSSVLSPQEKEQRVAVLAHAKQGVPQCPPRR